MTPADRLRQRLGRFPRAKLVSGPTPLEPMPRLSIALGGPEIWVKRDDLTGLAFGGNKARQLEFYLGRALEDGADTVLITGAVQSNFTRMAAAAARKLGLEAHLQLEERVAEIDALHRTNGNPLLSRLMGATLHAYPRGEDEAGADARLEQLASELRDAGRRPYVIPLAGDQPPTGALGYLDAAVEIMQQGEAPFDAVIVGTGSALTHIGLLVGLRALDVDTPVIGACVRRTASVQGERVLRRARDLADLTGLAAPAPDDVATDDRALPPGYGLTNAATRRAIQLTARTEGLFLDPVYTGKAMATLMGRIEAGLHRAGERVLFVHTGGTPALFGYGEALLDDC